MRNPIINKLLTPVQSQATPELSHRLFGSTSTLTTTISAKTTTLAGVAGVGSGAVTTTVSVAEPAAATLLEIGENPVHLPTILGLKIRAINPNTTSPQKQTQTQTQPPSPTQSQSQSQLQSKTKPKGNGSNSNSLLKQQLRGGAKDPEVPSASRLQAAGAAASPNEETDIECQEEAHSGLQSLANAAEQQAAQVSNSGDSLHHQLLLHLAANQQKASDYYQQQQQQQASPSSADQYPDDDMDLLCIAEQQDKADEEPDHDLLTLADENAGLPGYQQGTDSEPTAAPVKSTAASGGVRASNPPRLSSSKKPAKRPIQRRRVRRKAQSTIDDQAEHLTEMSVRGLDLFRYASVVEGVYRCTECAKENMQKTFKNKYSFQRHAFLYHEGKHRKVFPCPVCCKEFSRPDKMKNHLKMTHENFTPPKDIGAFSPLKYLINAAAAGDMHATMYQQQQQQLQQQEQYQRQLEQQMEQQQQQDSCLLLPEDVKQEDQDQELSDGYEASNPEAAAAAMLSLHHDVIIKNEIQISPSPSPSPSPPTTCAVAEGKTLALAPTAQTTAT